MKGLWANKEVNDLFETVEKNKKQGICLRKAFEQHAKKYNRKANSVRNYYYQEVDRLIKDEKRTKKLSINLANHKKSKSKVFTKIEEKNLINKIEDLTAKGKSVRAACFELSNGDPVLMLRYQNKYRNYNKKPEEQDFVEQSNIIRFTSQKQGLTENDINSLFMGLIRLVKRNLTNEIEKKEIAEKESLNDKLRKTITMLGEKENEISLLKEKFESLKKENQSLSQKMLKLKCEKASLLSSKNNKRTAVKQ